MVETRLFQIGDKVRWKPSGKVFTIKGRTERGLYICEPFAVFPYYMLEKVNIDNIPNSGENLAI